MQVHILVETWGFDAPRVIAVYNDGAKAREDHGKLPIPGNAEIWGPFDVIQ